jgi:HK97 family phage major capsid protein
MDKAEIQQLVRDVAGGEIGDIVEAKMAKALEKHRKESQTTNVNPFVRPYKNVGRPGDYGKKALEDLTIHEKGLLAGRTVRYLYLARGDMGRAYELAQANGDVAITEAYNKAMASDVFSTGGSLIPAEFTEGIIDELNAKSVVRQSGVDTWSMNTGSLSAPFIDTGATAAYVGSEGSNIVPSTPTTGQLQFQDKKLAALVPISNDMLRKGGAQVDRIIRDNIVRKLRLKEDITFIRSDGTLGEPQGLLYWAKDGGTVFNANATFNAANAATDLARAMRELEDLDVPLEGAVWLAAPRTKWALARLLDGNSNYIYRDEIVERNELLGHPLFVTSQIPTNLGGSSNESELYLYNAPLCVIAEQEFLLMEMFDNAAYHDGSAVQSGVSRDESVMRAIALHDFGCQQRGQEVVVIDAMTWA